MAEHEPVADVPRRIYIQINGEKTALIESALSRTIPEFRTILLSQKVRLPRDAQFLDAQGYPVSVINEKSFSISDLVLSTDDAMTIKLRAKEWTTHVDTQRSKIMTIKNIIIITTSLYFAYYISNEDNRKPFIHKQLCPLFIKFDFPVLLDTFKCSTGENASDNVIYQDTNGYLGDQIKDNIDGTEVLISTKKGLEKLALTEYNQHYVAMIDDWIKNRTIYKEDYKWYNNMKSTWGHCPGHFDEKVEHSNNLIENTPESIQEFTTSQFHDWPQNLTIKINLKWLQSAFDTNTDNIDFATNGKISTNMYLVAWKREENNTIRIHSYVTIFERTAGNGCHFVPEYWTGSRDKINNAKKYYLLTKIESNPVLKKFLLRIPQIT